MPAFSKTCVALTWTPQAKCYGVRVRGNSERSRIVACWQSGPESGDSLSGKLMTGATQLRAGNASQVLAGGSGPVGGFMDLTMPDLAADEQANALRFELAKFSPLSTDKLTWGYRAIGKREAQQQHIRLLYFPQEDWENWIDAVRGLTMGVDIIMPPRGALDPVLSGYDVCFPADDDTWYRDVGAGYRDCAAQATAGAATFGTPGEALEADGFDPGPLGELQPAEQHDFVEAAVLGMYGLSHAVDKDKRCWIRPPATIRPHRNRLAQTVTVLVALYLAGFAGFQGTRYVSAAYRYYQSLQHMNQQLREEIKRIESPETAIEQIEKVEEELADASVQRPSMTGCLLSLTNRTNDDVWMQQFSWDDGKMNVEIVTEKESVDLTETWEDSTVLTDVVPRQKKIDANDILNVSFQLYAGYDTADGERTPIPPLPEANLETDSPTER